MPKLANGTKAVFTWSPTTEVVVVGPHPQMKGCTVVFDPATDRLQWVMDGQLKEIPDTLTFTVELTRAEAEALTRRVREQPTLGQWDSNYVVPDARAIRKFRKAVAENTELA